VDAHVRNLDAIRIQRHVERTLTKAEFIDAATRLAAQLQHRIGGPSTTKRSQPWTGSKQIRGAWNTLELRQRKALLGAHIHYIIINPVGRQSGSRFHPSRTDIVWWGDPDPLYDPVEPDQLLPIDPHWLRTQLDDGRTYPSLGRELGCSATRIRRYAIDHDMRSKAKDVAAFHIDQTWLTQQLATGRTLTSIANQLGCSRGTVHNYAARYELPPVRNGRPPAHHHDETTDQA